MIGNGANPIASFASAHPPRLAKEKEIMDRLAASRRVWALDPLVTVRHLALAVPRFVSAASTSGIWNSWVATGARARFSAATASR